MEKKITIFCKNTQSYHAYPAGVTVNDVLNDLQICLKYPVVAARVNYKVEDLNFQIFKPKDIEFLDLSSSSGMRVYVRTLSMVVAKAVSELFPQALFRIEHPISKGYYCKLHHLGCAFTDDVLMRIKDKVNEIITLNKPVVCEEKQITEVKTLFSLQRHHADKTCLLETMGTPYFRYFRIDDYVDYYNGVLLPSTAYLSVYNLIPYEEGFLLVVPNRDNPVIPEEVSSQPKIFDIYQEYIGWNKIMDVNNIGEFNNACKNNLSFNLIKISEALHEKKVASIADMITQRNGVKFVLISGPSSSGKTTFSKRLSIQLMVCGLKPLVISMDNYFVDRDHTPKDENGDFDFEHLQALDLDLFNKNMQQLLNGEEIDVPSFSFEEGRRFYKGDKLRLKSDNVLILEGIHALNPDLLPSIPAETLFKIYVSAITTISIDNHNWIPTADTRLLRRIIRDYRYRSYSAQQTISRWPSVRRGEEKWIFPFQENADVMFNSALLFELAVLKKHAEPILAEVPKCCDEYTEAHRLLKFLSYFVPIYDREIPPTSLLREFVGGSSFHY